MKILVISDSHRRGTVVDRIILNHPEAKHIFFLGDVVSDIEDLTYEYTDRTFHIVSGNCDMFSTYPNTDIAKIGNINIFYTHGNNFAVKSSVEHIKNAAKQRNCKIALYGHTHIPYTSYVDEIHIVNPGSCAESRGGKNSYALIDIVDSGIVASIVYI